MASACERLGVSDLHLVWQVSAITEADRQARMAQRACVVWLTGLSGSGKSTLAFALEKALFDLGKTVYVLDGDNVRHALCRDLGFSAVDRAENIRRIAEVARLMNDAGLIVITAFISPYRADRELARAVIGKERFMEVFVSTPLQACEARDPKGLYHKARSGLLDQFTGISAPYEAPDAPDLTLDTSVLSVPESLARLLGSMPSYG